MNAAGDGGSFTYGAPKTDDDDVTLNDSENALQFFANFCLISVQLQRPNPYTGGSGSPSGNFILTLTTLDPDSNENDVTYTTYLSPANSEWPNSTATGTVLTANFPINAGTYKGIVFDVVDGYGIHYTTARQDGELETAKMKPNTWYQRIIGSNTWVRAQGYYMKDINDSSTSIVWKNARGILTIIDGCTEADAPEWEGKGYVQGSTGNDPSPAASLWSTYVRSRLNERKANIPLTVVYPYVVTFPNFSNTGNNIGFSNVGTTSNKGNIGTFKALRAETIGSYMFYNNPKLEDVFIPAAKTIGANAFENCVALQTVSMESAETIGANAFKDCKVLTDFESPVVNTTGTNAFLNCANLTTIDMPLINNLGTNSFKGCTELTSVKMPILKTITANSFENCSSLESITDANFPEATDINASAFAFTITTTGARSKLNTVNLSKVEKIGNNAFAGNTDLEEVEFPSAWTIGDSAFQNNPNLARVFLPRVHTIGNKAFAMTTKKILPEMSIVLGTECCTKEGDTSSRDQIFTAGTNLFDYRFVSEDYLGASGLYNADAKPITLELSQGFAKWSNGSSSTTQEFKVTEEKSWSSSTVGIQNETVTGHYWWTKANTSTTVNTNFGKFESITVVPLPSYSVLGEGDEVLAPVEW